MRNSRFFRCGTFLLPQTSHIPLITSAPKRRTIYLQNRSRNSAHLYLDPIRFDRFLWHGTLVRQVFHVSLTPSLCKAIRSLIQGVDMQNGGNPILPLLRTLKWWTSVPVLDHAFIPLFSPSLLHAKIDLSRSHDEAEIGQLFRRLRESSPFLEKLAIVMTPAVSTLGLSAAQELVNFPRLRKLRIFHIQAPATFRAIVMKPNLTSLNVALCRVRVTDPSLGIGPLISVHDLRELSVRGEASVFPSAFSNIRFTALQSAVIHLNNPMGSPLVLGDITKFLAPFYRSICDSDSLQDFELKIDLKALADLPPPGSEYPLRALLAPILPIGTMRSVRLIIANRFATLDDADIRAVASAWPRIKSLHTPHGYTLTSSISIDALHHLYTHCPDLEELSIPRFRWPQVEVGVHAIPLPPLSNDDVGRPPRAHPLWHLNIVHDRFKDEFLPLFGGTLSDNGVDAMARYLLELFPRLVSDPGLYAATLKHADDWWDPEKFRRPGFRLDDRWSRIVRRMLAICSGRSDEV